MIYFYIYYELFIHKNPLFILNTNYIKKRLDNTTFTNCYSDYGFLFNINHQPNNEYITIKNSVFESNNTSET